MSNLVNNMLKRHDSDLIKKKLLSKRKEYLNAWSKNSEYFYEKEYYAWMASKVAGKKYILEVGCGVGYSTLELLERGHKVISIEENNFCLDQTEDLLRKKGFKILKIGDREILKNCSNYRYDIKYHNIENKKIIESYDAVLIQGDVANDLSFIEWLTNSSDIQIDAVICWLLGSHGYRGHNNIFDLSTVKNSSAAKIYIQSRVYELCDTILIQDGYLHIVDRAIDSDDFDTHERTKEHHDDQASVTGMSIFDIDSRSYEEPEDGMEMVVRENITDLGINDKQYKLNEKRIFLSVLSKKE